MQHLIRMGQLKAAFSDKDTSLYSMVNNERYEDDKEDYQKSYYKDRYKFPFTGYQNRTFT